MSSWARLLIEEYKGGIMARKGFRRKLKPLEILTNEEIEEVHRGTLEVLWVTGVRMEHKRALGILERNGCKVDYENSRVRFPPALVEDCLRKCPSTFCLKAREPKNDLVLGGNTVYFSAFPGMKTVDLDTWEPRTATRKEFYDAVTILDALDTCDLFKAYTPYFGFEGVPASMAMLESFAGKARNSAKFQPEGYSNDSELFSIEMAQALGTEIYLYALPGSPLTYFSDAIEASLRGAEAGLAVKVGDGPMFGGTAPATIAGALITHNAECMAPIVLLQIVKPGTRIIASHLDFPLNMQNGAPTFGDIGTSLHTVSFNQIWRRKYGVPTANLSSISSSKQADFQGGYERATAALLCALSGANYVALHGSIHGELTHHPVQAILDDDLAGMIGRFIQGIEVNDETLAIDLIEEVGPIPGHFLNKAHTRKWWKLEQFVPRAADRLTYPEWMKSGKKSCLDYARERMEQILATHKPTPLTSRQEEDIERILEEARQHYKDRGLISAEEMATYRASMKSPDYPYE